MKRDGGAAECTELRGLVVSFFTACSKGDWKTACYRFLQPVLTANPWKTVKVIGRLERLFLQPVPVIGGGVGSTFFGTKQSRYLGVRSMKVRGAPVTSTHGREPHHPTRSVTPG